MFDYLENLRKKPIHYRKRVAFLTATIITAIIVGVWISTQNFAMSEEVDSKALSDDFKPIEEIKNNVASFIETVKKMGADIFGSATTTQ